MKVEDIIKLIWKDYDICDKAVIETWLDPEARKMTGIDGSFEELYRYWAEQKDASQGKEVWCKVIFHLGTPVAVILIGSYKDEFTLSEIIVSPEHRNKGVGASVLSELLECSSDIIGREILSLLAVIYPNNKASKRAFEKAGFIFNSLHPDGDAMYYMYRKEVK